MLKLVDGARDWWRWHSNQLALAAGAFLTWAALDHDGFAELWAHVPEPLQPFSGVIVTIAVVYVRLIKQGSTDGK